MNGPKNAIWAFHFGLVHVHSLPRLVAAIQTYGHPGETEWTSPVYSSHALLTLTGLTSKLHLSIYVVEGLKNEKSCSGISRYR